MLTPQGAACPINIAEASSPLRQLTSPKRRNIFELRAFRKWEEFQKNVLEKIDELPFVFLRREELYGGNDSYRSC